MTREEVITRLKNMAWLYGSVERKQNIEAIDMAITALKGGDAEMQTIAKTPDYMQETPSEDGSDIISRADAKKEVYLLGKNPSINEIWDCLDALPSADRPSGEWIKDYEKNIYKCSVCGCEEVVPTCMGEPTIWKYCPNCGSVIGARMKGGTE